MIAITTVDAGPHTGSVFARWTDHTEMGRALQQMKGAIDARTADGRAYQIILPEQAQAHPEGGWIAQADIVLERWQDARRFEIVATRPDDAKLFSGTKNSWHYCDATGITHIFVRFGEFYTHGVSESGPLMLADNTP